MSCLDFKMVLLSPKLALYYCSRVAVTLGNLILGGIISLLCRISGGCEGGGGEVNASLPCGRTVLQIVTVFLLDFCSSYVLCVVSYDDN